MTIREALRLAAARLEQAGVPDADVDAAYLLASVLKEDTLAMRINGHRELAAPQRAAFDALCDRRAAREPLQYITGEVAFRHIAVKVRPGVLILDEPTAGLDPAGCQRILETICDYREKTGSTVVIVSHSMDDVARIADRLIVFNHGSIRFDGTPEEVFSNPKELSDIGLSVPAPTQIASALREQGVEIEGSVYTTEQLLAALLKLKKEVGRNA